MSTIKIIRIGQIVSIPLMFIILLFTAAGQPYDVACAEATWQPVNQSILYNSEIAGDMSSAQFQPPGLSRRGQSGPPSLFWFEPDLLPPEFDWRSYISVDTNGSITNNSAFISLPKQQGQCGSCYAFATVGAIEAYLARQGVDPSLLDISEENAKNCNPNTQNRENKDGCAEGNGAATLNWFNIMGTTLEQSDPYAPRAQACNTDIDYQHTILGWLEIGRKNKITPRATLKNYLINYGPLVISVAMENSTFQSYEYTSNSVEPLAPIHFSTPPYPDGIDHLILLVGWDDNVPHQHQEGQGVWIVKNSWGTDGWGDKGYGEVAYGSVNLEQGKAYVPSQHQKYDPDGMLLYNDTFGRGNQTRPLTGKAMVKLIPQEDSCATRIEFQHEYRENIPISSYTVSIYDEQLDDLSPTEPLIKGLQVYAPAGGNISLELENPLPLFKDNAVYVVVEPGKASKLTYDKSTKIEGRNYYNNSNEWKATRYAFNVRLRTTKCGVGTSFEPTPTTTPFMPVPTQTAQPTPTPTSVLTFNQRAASQSGPTIPVAEVCSVPTVKQSVIAAAQNLRDVSPPSKPRELMPNRFPSFEPRRQSSLGQQPPSSPIEIHGVSRSDRPGEMPIVEQKYYGGLGIAEVAPNVQGTVLLPDDAAAADALLSFYHLDDDGNAPGIPNASIQADSDGEFELHLIEGDYLLWIDPPSKTIDDRLLDGVIPITRTFSVGDAMMDLDRITLPATTKTIRGSIVYRTPSDQKLSMLSAKIKAFNLDTRQNLFTYPENDGTFKIDVGGGQWKLSLLLDPGVNWVAVNPIQQAIFKADSSTETISDVTFMVAEPDAMLTGQVQYPSGKPLHATDEEVDEGFNYYASLDVYSLDSERFSYGYLDASGRFTIPLLSGRYESLVWLDAEVYSQYTGPIQQKMISIISGTVDIGAIKILANNATVSGYVHDSDGKTLPYIFVDLWQDNGLWIYGATNASGYYEIEAPTGVWRVQPYVMDYQAHVFTGQPETVETMAYRAQRVDFSLEPSAGNLFGTVVDGEGNLLADLDATAYIRRGDGSTPIVYGFIDNGTFELKMPYGDDLRVGLYLDPSSPYFLPAEVTPMLTAASAPNSFASLSAVSLASREQASFPQLTLSDRRIELELVRADAQIVGKVIEGGRPVTNTSGYVVATEQGRPQNWKWSEIDEDGSYALNVTSGIWDLFYELDDDDTLFMSYSEHPTQVTIEEDVSVLTQDLIVQVLDSFIKGIVVDENGNSLPNHPVWARLENYESNTYSDDEGIFTLYMPQMTSVSGDQTIQLQAKIGTHPSQAHTIDGSPELDRSNSFQASEILQTSPVPIQQKAGDQRLVTLTVPMANTYLTGQVLDGRNGNQPVKNAQVSGVGSDGQSFAVSTDEQGCFAAPVYDNSGNEWQLIAAYGNSGGIRLTASSIIRNDAQSLSTNSALLLEYRETMPHPETAIFAPSEGWRYTLSDGFTVEIQPNSISSPNSQTDRVNIELKPWGEGHHTYLHKVLGYGYQISLADSKGRPLQYEFQHDIRLVFPHIAGMASDEERLVIGEFIDGQWDVSRPVLPLRTSKRSGASIGYEALIERPGIYALLELNEIDPDVSGVSAPAQPTAIDQLPEPQQMKFYLPFVSQ